MSTVTVNGSKVDFDAAVNLMDDEIREEMHGVCCTEQEFVDAYVVLHAEKFGGEEFTV